MDCAPRKANSNRGTSIHELIPCRSVAVVHTFLGGIMIRRSLVVGLSCVALGTVLAAQTKTVPRPPAQPAGQQPPGESAAPDGYQPLPLWLGQTRAPAPAKIETFTVETFAQGVNGAALESGVRRCADSSRRREERPNPDRREGRQGLRAARGHAVGHVYDRAERVQRTTR